jgi:hypothetical protein
MEVYGNLMGILDFIHEMRTEQFYWVEHWDIVI